MLFRRLGVGVAALAIIIGAGCGRTEALGPDVGGGSASIASGEGGEPSGGLGAAAGGAEGDGSSGDVFGRVWHEQRPASGVLVGINGVVQSTDKDGKFSFPDVPASYQLVVVDQASAAAAVLEGLVTRSPSVNMGSPPGQYSATARVSVPKLGSPGSDDEYGQLIYDSPSSGRSAPGGTIALTRDATALELAPTWDGAEVNQGTLSLLQFHWVGENSDPEFLRFGQKQVELRHGEVLDVGELSLQKPRLKPIAGSISSVPDGLKLTNYVVLTMGKFRIGFQAERSFSLDVPDLGLLIDVQYSARDDERNITFARDFEPFGETALQLAPRAIVPEDAAAGVRLDSEFAWQGVPGLVECIQWHFEGWFIVRCVDPTTLVASIPDLSSFGVTLPGGASGTWNILSWGPVNSVDEMLTVSERLRLDEPVDYQYGSSARRAFTLAE